MAFLRNDAKHCSWLSQPGVWCLLKIVCLNTTWFAAIHNAAFKDQICWRRIFSWYYFCGFIKPTNLRKTPPPQMEKEYSSTIIFCSVKYLILLFSVFFFFGSDSPDCSLLIVKIVWSSLLRCSKLNSRIRWCDLGEYISSSLSQKTGAAFSWSWGPL